MSKEVVDEIKKQIAKMEKEKELKGDEDANRL